MGIVKSKSISFWWPGIDNDVERFIKNCGICASQLPDPRKCELVPWKSSNRPSSRIHLDYAGPFKDFYFLILVDSYSNWIEVSKTLIVNSQ